MCLAKMQQLMFYEIEKKNNALFFFYIFYLDIVLKLLTICQQQIYNSFQQKISLIN